MSGMSSNAQNAAPVRPMRNQDATNAARLIDIFFPGHIAVLQALGSIAMVLLGWFAVTVEVFIRYKFGERYFNVVKIAIATLMMWTVIQAGLYLSQFSSTAGLIATFLLLRVLWYAYIIAALYHYVSILLRNRRGEVWHTQSYGLSHLYRIPFLQQFDDWVLYRVVEPVACIALAWVVTFINAPLGVWLYIAGIALLLRNNLAYMEQRSTLLDLMDERIHSQYLAAALSGASKTETLGWSVAKVPTAIFPEVAAVAKAAAAAPPDFTDQIAARLRTAAPTVEDTADTLEPPEMPPPATADNGPVFNAYQEQAHERDGV